MKKRAIISTIVLTLLLVIGLALVFWNTDELKEIKNFSPRAIYKQYMNWHEAQTQKEIESANNYAKERLEKRYHVFVNNIFVDIGYDWDGSLFVPIRSVAESFNWAVYWIPEQGVIQIVKESEEAYVDIVNFFGKAYVDLRTLENLLRIQEVTVRGGNIEITNDPAKISSFSLNKLKRYEFYINRMKMTDKAVEYQGEKYVPAQIFAMSFGRIFRVDAQRGLAYIDNEQIKSLFVDGDSYSTLDNLQRFVNTEGCSFEYLEFPSGNRELPSVVYKGPGNKNVALTFDDYLGDKVYPLLDVLKKNNVKATFYVIGNSVESNSAIAKAIVQEGHEIGNHTWDHLNLYTLRDDEIRAQLISTQLALERHSGKKPVTFRPPGGYYDSKVVSLALDVGLKTVLWSLNSNDADDLNGPAVIKKALVNSIHPGAVIVMHMNKEATIEALTEAIQVLKNRGYSFVTISQMINGGGRD